MSTTNAIDFLNATVKLRIAPSPIHGVGVFAMRDIPKGTKLYADRAPQPYRISEGNLSKLFPDVLTELSERWPRMLLGEGFAYPYCFIQGFMNHADEPNYDNALDIALCDIKAGEEVTEDYRAIPGWEKAFPWLASQPSDTL
jgi:SET domain-containing protein